MFRLVTIVFFKKEDGSSVSQFAADYLQGGYHILQTGDKLLPKTNGETNKNLASRSVDALAMLDQANDELSRLRREQIRFALRPEYSYICKAEIPNGPLLFGEDLPKQLKKAMETNAFGQSLTHLTKKRRTLHIKTIRHG